LAPAAGEALAGALAPLAVIAPVVDLEAEVAEEAVAARALVA